MMAVEKSEEMEFAALVNPAKTFFNYRLEGNPCSGFDWTFIGKIIRGFKCHTASVARLP
jgi:hypothetical protein